jgi:putative transposase
LRKEFPELKEFLWGDSFWADGYFAETVGQVNEEIVKKYIRDHRAEP